MSDPEHGPFKRVCRDVSSAVDTWLFGIATIAAALLTPVAVWMLGMPQALGSVLMLALLAIHLLCGAQGYYPRGLGR